MTMVFSDEDLADCKSELENVWAFKGDREKMIALLARLEAAEAVASHYTYGNTPITLIEAWRKAAGRE